MAENRISGRRYSHAQLKLSEAFYYRLAEYRKPGSKWEFLRKERGILLKNKGREVKKRISAAFYIHENFSLIFHVSKGDIETVMVAFF